MKLTITTLFFGLALMTNAQGLTKEELKIEREQMKVESASKKAIEMEKMFEELAPVGGNMANVVSNYLSTLPKELNDKVEQPLRNLVGDKDARIVEKPATVGLNSVDGLVDAGGSLLAAVTLSNEILKEYRREVVSNGDGEVDITKYKANGKDYIAVLPLLLNASVDAATATAQIKVVQDDVKKLNPIQGKTTIAASKWAINAVNVSSKKLGDNTKLLKNLIETLKSSGNL